MARFGRSFPENGLKPAPITTLTLVPASASITVSGSALVVSSTLIPTAATVTITGVAPVVYTSSPVTPIPTAASITVTGVAPVVILPIINVPTGAAVSITPNTPTVAAGVALVPTAAGIAVTGTAPTLTNGALVAYDATGAGATGGGAGSSTMSFTHTAAAGADVFLYMVTDRSAAPSSVQYAGTAMTLLGSQACNNTSSSYVGSLYVYHLGGVAGGSAAVTASFPPCWWAANTVSYVGATRISALQNAYGNSTTPSSGSITIPAGQVAVCAVGAGIDTAIATLSSPTGGTNRYLGNNSSGAIFGTTGLAISDSTSSVSFGATLSASSFWATTGFTLSGGGATIPTAATITVTGSAPVVSVSAGSTSGVAYDATGAGATGGGASISTMSFTHTAAAGADVFLSIITDRAAAPTSVQYAGTAMTLLGSQACNNTSSSTVGSLYVYHLGGVAGGSAAVTASFPPCWWIANTVSYTGVTNVGALQTAYGTGTTVSSGTVVADSAGQTIIMCAVGAGIDTAIATLSSPTGGTNRYLGNNSSGAIFGTTGLAISDSTSWPRFGATLSASSSWATAAVVLAGAVSTAPIPATITVTGGTPSIITPTILQPAAAAVTVTGSAPGVSAAAAGTLVPNGALVKAIGAVPVISMAITPASATVAVTAGTTLVVTTAPYGPFSTVLTRLANGQSTTIQIIGDSTAAGQYDTGNLQGWVGRLGILLGQYYNANVVYRDFSTSLYSSTGSYTAPVSLYSSSNGSGAPQILLMNGGVPGANLNNQNQWLSGGLLPISNPDVIIVAEGFNDLSSLGLRDSAATYTAALRSFISAVSTTCPNVPIIITTENVPDGIYTYSTFAAGFSAMTQSYVGQSLPLSPPLQQSGTSEVWLLDTQQAFPSSQLNTLTTTLDGGYRLHPSPAGYAAQASYMLAQLAPSIAAPSVVIPTPATVTVVGGTPTTNYAFVSPAPATVFITGVTPVVTGITNAITPAAASIALTTTAPVTILGGNTSAIPTAATIALGTTAPLIALQVGTPTLTVTQNWGNPNLTGTVTFWPIQPTGPAATAQIIGGVLCDANGNFGVTLTSALAPGGGPAIYLVSVDLIYYGWREVEIPRFAIPAVGNTVNGNTVNLGSAFPAVNHRLGIPADAVRASDTLTLPLEEDMTVYIDPAPQWVQANDAVLDYTLDWSLPLASTGDTVAAATFTPSYIAGQASQLTVVSTNTTPTTATVWLTGGVSGQLYSVMCHIITAEGRQDDRTFQVLVQNT